MSTEALEIIISAQDRASTVFHAVAGVLSSVVVGALADAARASEDTEAAIRGLGVAVDNAGGSWKDSGRAIEATISQYQHLTGVSDGQLRPALANLINETGSVDDGLDRMSTALDLAAGAHISLEQASRVVGKVSEENLNVFRRLGLDLTNVVKPGMTDAAKEGAVLAAVADRYSGAAAAAKKPTDDWTNALHDLQNNVGGMLGPLASIVALAPGISATFTAISAGVSALIPLLAALDLELAPILAGIAVLAGVGLLAGVAGYEGASIITGQGLSPIFGIGESAPNAGPPGLPEGAMTNFGAPLYDSYGNQFGSQDVPGFATGGVVPGAVGAPMRAIVHGGETITPPGRSSGDIHVHVDGTVYSMGDFETQVAIAVRNVKERGGFRGVMS